MARYREFKGIASGILGSFNSRNNDISGYWAIGVLSLHAQRMGTDVVVFDLVNLEIEPEIPEALSLVRFYSSMLHRLMEKGKLPESWLRSASIVVKFNQPFQPKYHHFRSDVAAPYMCSIEILDDRGKKHEVVAGGNCWPHDPKRESRSGRVNRV